jgi:hypothetical protein
VEDDDDEEEEEEEEDNSARRHQVRGEQFIDLLRPPTPIHYHLPLARLHPLVRCPRIKITQPLQLREERAGERLLDVDKQFVKRCRTRSSQLLLSFCMNFRSHSNAYQTQGPEVFKWSFCLTRVGKALDSLGNA